MLLRALAEVPGNTLNESIAKTALAHFGHRAPSDVVRAHLDFLDRHGLLRIERIEAARGELWVATLTVAGLDVANGNATHPGVARRMAV